MRMRHDGGNALKFQEDRDRLTASPLNPLECGSNYYFMILQQEMPASTSTLTIAAMPRFVTFSVNLFIEVNGCLTYPPTLPTFRLKTPPMIMNINST